MIDAITFHPFAWFKLQWFCHKGDTEIGGYGVAKDKDKPLYIHDLVIPKQECSGATTDLDMDDLSLRWETLIEEGLQSSQYAAIWIHTHPMDSAEPSGTDEETFKAFRNQWAVMFILSRTGKTYCRLKVQAPSLSDVTVTKQLTTQIDYQRWSEDAVKLDLNGATEEWEKEYQENIKKRTYYYSSGYSNSSWSGGPYVPGHVSSGSHGPGHGYGFHRQDDDYRRANMHPSAQEFFEQEVHGYDKKGGKAEKPHPFVSASELAKEHQKLDQDLDDLVLITTPPEGMTRKEKKARNKAMRRLALSLGLGSNCPEEDLVIAAERALYFEELENDDLLHEPADSKGLESVEDPYKGPWEA